MYNDLNITETEIGNMRIILTAISILGVAVIACLI